MARLHCLLILFPLTWISSVGEMPLSASSCSEPAVLTQGNAALQTSSVLRHHPTKEESCAACAASKPNEVCYSGKCGDGSGMYCWSWQPQEGLTPC
mmetsp:Transcript_41117/g.87584  ORF Transcript_41117/g.87584 Transcript_41117/m.87584 type:complete len:96 (-) Transcript_41117:59-346(-)